MRYAKSVFIIEYEKVIDFYINIIKYAYVNKYSYDIIRCIFVTSISQASACFENYIKDIISDWIVFLKKTGRHKRRYPDALLASILIKMQKEHYKTFLLNGREKELIDRSASIFSPLMNDRDDYLNMILNEKAIVNDRKYPSVKNIKVLFNRIGIDSIFNEISKRGKLDSEKTLQSFMDIRTEMAHSNFTLLFNKNDVIQQLNNIKKLTSIIDKILFYHIRKYSDKKFWKQGTF